MIYNHGTIKDFVANWAERGLDGDALCFQAVANDGAIALVPYSAELLEHGVGVEDHLREMAHDAIEELRED